MVSSRGLCAHLFGGFLDWIHPVLDHHLRRLQAEPEFLRIQQTAQARE